MRPRKPAWATDLEGADDRGMPGRATAWMMVGASSETGEIPHISVVGRLLYKERGWAWTLHADQVRTVSCSSTRQPRTRALAR